jgi:hypothetical protein
VSGLPFERVWARAQTSTRRYHRRAQRKGVALVVTNRFAIFKQAWTNESDPATVQLAPPGFTPVARSRDYAAYARC